MSARVTPRPLTTRPTVSVFIPCYNYGHFLRQCVGSVLSQEGVDVDVLIIDDASPDGSVAVARELAAEDSRVRVIENEVNKGHIATYNLGLGAATGDYLVLLSADDLLAPGSLGRACALLEAHPEVSFVYGYVPDFNTEPPPAKTEVRDWSVWTGPEWLELIGRRAHNVVSCPEVVMRTSVYRDLGSYEPRLPHSADFYLWMAAATRGSVGRINGADQAFYRVHGNNMHLEKFAGVYTDLRERRKAYELLFAEHGDRMPDPAGLEALVRRSMARDALQLTCRAYDRSDEALLSRATELMEFAAETDPTVRDTPLWRACAERVDRYKNGQRPGSRHRAVAVADDLRGRVRWRRWRRTGI
ncbi:glycosyltransferase family 2 protein [Actinoplanes sp. CA-252034]|uniref:glycosyltransferase family 2 protein n=1 Tax=Actinoplanes sp. CA-252034 TaxID=3239906 RepID=UPI003D96135B